MRDNTVDYRAGEYPLAVTFEDRMATGTYFFPFQNACSILRIRGASEHEKGTAMNKLRDEDLSRIASRIWAEGRCNPLDWEIRTPLGTFTTDDRAVWLSDGTDWTAELRRSRNGRHTYLALFEAGAYRGRYDDDGWRAATARSRIRHLRSYQLPLVA